jgi:hypothetical protein
MWEITPSTERVMFLGSRQVFTNVFASLGRKTPYAWMWQLGSERIVGNSYLIAIMEVLRA